MRRMRRTVKSEKPGAAVVSLSNSQARAHALHRLVREVTVSALSQFSCDIARGQIRKLNEDRPQRLSALRCCVLVVSRELRVTQDNTALLGRLKARRGTLRDHAPLLLGKGCVDVQRERIDVAPQCGHQEGNALHHQIGDERDIARQAVKFRDSHMAFRFLRCLQRSAQLRPALERIAALARLDLSEINQDLKALSLGKRDDSAPLRPEAKAAPALLRGGDAVAINLARMADFWDNLTTINMSHAFRMSSAVCNAAQAHPASAAT